ncbi:MAG: hypothetical protein DIKNOCCD_02814 [bacterium]|nr:hypothetical protein [bacterium]
MRRLFRFISIIMASGLLWSVGLQGLQAEEAAPVNPMHQNWASQVEQKRKEAREAAAKEKKGPPPAASPAANSGAALIDGKKIRLRARPTATPTPAPAGAPPKISGATATSATTTTTATPTATLTSTPTVTPTPIIVKRPKVVDGKIIMVDVEVTPTPAPANVADATLAQASQTARKIISATGMMGEIRDQLTQAIASASKSITLSPKYYPKIREEVMAATTKRKGELKGVLSASQTLQLQIKVSRLTGSSKGSVVDAALAADILKVLWPKEAPALLARLKAKSKKTPDTESGGSEEDLFIEEGADASSTEREIFIDPDTGAYVYEDGTPVQYAPAAPANPPVAPQPPPPPPVVYQETYYPPPPPPPPPPQYQEYPEENYIDGNEGEYVEDTGDDQYIEEDPSLYEEPQQDNYIEENLDYNQDDFQEIDGEVQDYGDEGYIEEGEF